MNTLWLILRQESTIRIGWVLIHFVWQAATIGGVAAVLLRLLRKFTPQARYLVLCLSMLVMALCPLVTYGIITAMDSSSSQPFGQLSASEKWRLLQGTSLLPQPVTLTDIVERNLPAITMVWASGVILLSVRMFGGMWLAHRLIRRQVKPISGWLTERAVELSGVLGIRSKVSLRESSFIQVPSVVGCLRSIILFPATAMTGLPVSQLEALLAHELAHVRRHDYLVNLLQTGVETILFYHPVVWWVSRRIRIERENCCDDIVLMLLNDRRNYASALASLEEIRAARTLPAIAATGGELLPRIRRILGEKSMNAQPNFQWVAVLGIALAITPFALVKLQAEPPIGITPNSNPAATTLENRVFTVLNQDDDVAALKAKIKSLEAENRRLKAQSSNRSRADLSRDIRVHEAAAREEVARAQTLERNALKQRTEELARLRQAEAAENSVQVDRQRDLARRDADIARRDLDLARERAEKDQAVEKSRADLALRDADLAQERQKRALVEAQNRDLALAEVEKARVLVEQSQARNRDIETALEDRVRASQRKEDTGLRERREFEQVRRAQKSTVDAQIRQLRDQNRVLQQQMRELQNQIKELQKQKATAVRP